MGINFSRRSRRLANLVSMTRSSREKLGQRQSRSGALIATRLFIAGEANSAAFAVKPCPRNSSLVRAKLSESRIF